MECTCLGSADVLVDMARTESSGAAAEAGTPDPIASESLRTAWKVGCTGSDCMLSSAWEVGCTGSDCKLSSAWEVGHPREVDIHAGWVACCLGARPEGDKDQVLLHSIVL